MTLRVTGTSGHGLTLLTEEKWEWKAENATYDYAVRRFFGKKDALFFQDSGLPKGYGSAVVPSKAGGWDVIGRVRITID